MRHTDEELEKAIKGLGAIGRLIEGGWLAYRMRVVPRDAPEVQVRECRLAFYAGASHLFYGILMALEEGLEETEADLDKMRLIDMELRNFHEQVKKEEKTP